MSAWLADPATREPLPAIRGDRDRQRGRAAHWLMERDDSGRVVRMRFRFCDDRRCCAPLPDMAEGG